jgi:hypothetical protein
MGQSSKFGYGAMLAVATHWDSWARGTHNMKVSLGKVPRPMSRRNYLASCQGPHSAGVPVGTGR